MSHAWQNQECDFVSVIKTLPVLTFHFLWISTVGCKAHNTAGAVDQVSIYRVLLLRGLRDRDLHPEMIIMLQSSLGLWTASALTMTKWLLQSDIRNLQNLMWGQDAVYIWGAKIHVGAIPIWVQYHQL